MASDKSADIARFIMHGDSGTDPRNLIFDVLRIWHRASGEEIKRGIRIALEMYEVDVTEANEASGG